MISRILLTCVPVINTYINVPSPANLYTCVRVQLIGLYYYSNRTVVKSVNDNTGNTIKTQWRRELFFSSLNSVVYFYTISKMIQYLVRTNNAVVKPLVSGFIFSFYVQQAFVSLSGHLTVIQCLRTYSYTRFIGNGRENRSNLIRFLSSILGMDGALYFNRALICWSLALLLRYLRFRPRIPTAK